MAYKFNPFTGKLDLVGGGSTQQYYAEPVINPINNDVIYQTGSNPVPDFIFDNNGDFVMTLKTI